MGVDRPCRCRMQPGYIHGQNTMKVQEKEENELELSLRNGDKQLND
ncbi:hypothetical protein [Peribacillus simplex]|nr:hypothetical protein [Peribacillus simplex]